MSASPRMRPRAATLVLTCALAWLCLQPAARADVVDDAFARGNTAASAGQWSEAATHYEEAEALLPGRSAALSYNLGTAYAHLADYGRATFHLRRALQTDARPTAEVADAAQRNLGIVQRRAEVEATSAGARLGRPDTGWGPVLAAARSHALGWLALALGWLGLGLWWIARWRQRRGGSEPERGGASAVGSLVVVLLALYVILGAVHGLAVRAEQNTPPAIVLDAQVAVRDAPGAHRKQIFTVQGGSQVRIVDRTRDWCQIRLSDGLEGWIPEIALGQLSSGAARRIRGRSRAPAPVSS